ncbi:MAG: glycosyltransferase [Planctomycetes bacterium]|nr:glycosyltransferase [Planctomycetota bacterium]
MAVELATLAKAIAEPNVPSPRDRILQVARECEQRLPADFVARHKNTPIKVVVVCYEHPEQTIRAIKALQVNVRIPFSVLLFDDGSCEATRDYLRKLAQGDDRIELILSSENIGCTRGRMAMLDRVQDEFVLLIDNDCEVMPGAIEHLLLTLETNPQAQAATGRIVLPSGKVQLCGGTYRIENGVLHHELLDRHRDVEEPIRPSGFCDWASNCLTLFRTEIFRRHPLDSTVRYYYEDLEWGYRLTHAGEAAIIRCPDAIGIHDTRSKVPDATWPELERRRHAMRFLETMSHFYRKHGLIIEDAPLFMPELGDPNDPRSFTAAKILFELLLAKGSDSVLKMWQEGALSPLFVNDQKLRLIEELRAALENREAQLAALKTHVFHRDAQHAALTTHVGHRDAQYAALTRELAKRDASLRHVEQSKSWRLANRFHRIQRRIKSMASKAFRMLLMKR